MDLQHEPIATGRTTSLFAEDLEANAPEMWDALEGKRIVIVGAAGSIGSAVTKVLLRFRPSAVALVDLSENNLVELVRDLHSTDTISLPADFAALPIGIGSVEFDRYIRETVPFDFFFNLSAIKHVRSEKDIYSIIRMLDTNVLFLHDFFQQAPYTFERVFSVSSDKASNPANLMGASKMIMEKVLLTNASRQPFAAARFANVAFSDGSLPFGFIERINKRQPIAAPSDVKRYFISHQEAGELCVMACVLSNNREVFFPKLSSGTDEKTFAEIALALLDKLGYEGVPCDSEVEAKMRCSELISQKKWPCLLLPSTTSGEKAYEEFFTQQEDVILERFRRVGVIRRESSELEGIERFTAFCRAAKHDPEVTKRAYVDAIQKLVPTLNHVETGKHLDQRM